MDPFVSDYIVTVRNRRFVLPLKLNYSERLEGIVQDRSVSGETLFVEPMWAVDLNNRLMMHEREAEAEEYRLLMRLTAMVRGYLPELQMTFAAMVELDALNARAIFAERFGCIEPEIVDDGIDLIAARHPLLMTSGREVVPIDVTIAPGQRGIVISGPNTGGKTVALKTVGLFALMAQAGILVPVEEHSKIKVFRSIFADIGDAQSIEASLSSFAAHITNLSEIIRCAPRTRTCHSGRAGRRHRPGRGRGARHRPDGLPGRSRLPGCGRDPFDRGQVACILACGLRGRGG